MTARWKRSCSVAWLWLVPAGNSVLAQLLFYFSFFSFPSPFFPPFLSFLLSSLNFSFLLLTLFFFKCSLFSFSFFFSFQWAEPSVVAQAEPPARAGSSAMVRALWSVVTNNVMVTSKQLFRQMASVWSLLFCLAQSHWKYDMVTKEK